MRRPSHSTEALVILVSGAGNLGRGKWSTAAPHFRWLMRSLQAGPERVVAAPIVPGQFGLKNLESVYDRFADQFNGLSDQHPNARVVAVGHSLGGLLIRRYAAEASVAGLITLGSPHDGVRSYLPAWIRAEYQAFTDGIPVNIMANAAQVAAKYDELVSPASAHAGLPRARKLTVERHHFMPITHNGLPLAPAVIQASAQLVDEMLAAQQLPPGQPDYSSLPKPA